jgi:hypothetical protein
MTQLKDMTAREFLRTTDAEEIVIVFSDKKRAGKPPIRCSHTRDEVLFSWNIYAASHHDAVAVAA